MKLTSLIATALTAAVASADVNQCSFSLLRPLILGDGSKCSEDAAYNFRKADKPTAEQLNAFCDSEACGKVMKQLLEADPEECTLPNSDVLLRSDLLEPFSKCEGATPTGAPTSTPTSEPTVAPTSGPTAAPTTAPSSKPTPTPEPTMVPTTSPVPTHPAC